MFPILRFSILRTPAENIIFFVIKRIFHSGLDGTMILYTILACFVSQTEIRQMNFSNQEMAERFLHIAPLSKKNKIILTTQVFICNKSVWLKHCWWELAFSLYYTNCRIFALKSNLATAKQATSKSSLPAHVWSTLQWFQHLTVGCFNSCRRHLMNGKRRLLNHPTVM